MFLRKFVKLFVWLLVDSLGFLVLFFVFVMILVILLDLSIEGKVFRGW